MGVNNKNAQDNIQLKGNKKPLQVLHISKKDTQKKSQDIDNEQTNSQEEIKKEDIAIKPQIIKNDSVKKIEDNIENIKDWLNLNFRFVVVIIGRSLNPYLVYLLVM